jgi:tRNA pseudouridine38-40 synthase
VRFGYDGTALHGWARQPGRATVEGELRRGLRRVGVVPSRAAIELAVASRTDRGVSARANALTLVSSLGGSELLDRLNVIDPSMFFTAASPVPDDFRVRSARRRTYRYFEATVLGPPGLRAEAARSFSGEVDVRSFGRGLPSSPAVRRRVESVDLTPVFGGEIIEVRAPSFVWGMVRKIVGSLREVGAGRLSIPRLRAAIEGRVRLALPLAEPEPLVLWEVDLGVPWNFRWSGPRRAQQARQIDQRNAWWVRGHLLSSLPPYSEGGGAQGNAASGAGPGAPAFCFHR